MSDVIGTTKDLRGAEVVGLLELSDGTLELRVRAPREGSVPSALVGRFRGVTGWRFDPAAADGESAPRWEPLGTSWSLGPVERCDTMDGGVTVVEGPWGALSVAADTIEVTSLDGEHMVLEPFEAEALLATADGTIRSAADLQPDVLDDLRSRDLVTAVDDDLGLGTRAHLFRALANGSLYACVVASGRRGLGAGTLVHTGETCVEAAVQADGSVSVTEFEPPEFVSRLADLTGLSREVLRAATMDSPWAATREGEVSTWVSCRVLTTDADGDPVVDEALWQDRGTDGLWMSVDGDVTSGNVEPADAAEIFEAMCALVSVEVADPVEARL